MIESDIRITREMDTCQMSLQVRLSLQLYAFILVGIILVNSMALCLVRTVYLDVPSCLIISSGSWLPPTCCCTSPAD